MRGTVARVLIATMALALSACVTASEAPAVARAVSMACVAVDLSPGAVAPTSGVVRAPLGPALVGGLRDGLRLERAAAVRAPEAELVSGGWLVAGRLADGAGTAVWLSQFADGAVFTSTGTEGPAERTRWAAAPWASPEHTFLFAAEPVAAAVSVWRDVAANGIAPLPAEALDRARACLDPRAIPDRSVKTGVPATTSADRGALIVQGTGVPSWGRGHLGGRALTRGQEGGS